MLEMRRKTLEIDELVLRVKALEERVSSSARHTPDASNNSSP